MNNRSLLLASILLLGLGSSLFAMVAPARPTRADETRLGERGGPRLRRMRRAFRRHQRITPAELMERRKKRLVILDKLKSALDKAGVAKDDSAYEWVENSRERVRRRIEGAPRRYAGRRRAAERRGAPARRSEDRKAEDASKKDEGVTSKIARALGLS